MCDACGLAMRACVVAVPWWWCGMEIWAKEEQMRCGEDVMGICSRCSARNSSRGGVLLRTRRRIYEAGTKTELWPFNLGYPPLNKMAGKMSR